MAASHAKHLLRLITDLTTMALSTSSPSQIDQLEDVLALLNDLYGKCGDELQLGTWYNMHDDHADALAKLRRTAEYAFPQPLVVDGVIDSTARVVRRSSARDLMLWDDLVVYTACGTCRRAARAWPLRAHVFFLHKHQIGATREVPPFYFCMQAKATHRNRRTPDCP